MKTKLKILGPNGHTELMLEGQALVDKAQELIDQRYALFGEDDTGPITIEVVPQQTEIIAILPIAGG